MTDQLRVGVIGTGDPDTKSGPMGFAMAYGHGDAYEKIDGCDIVAACDIKEDLARKFADRYEAEHVYRDYRKMLAELDLDVLSICTWMHLHEQMVLDAIDAGVSVIHCEKPMADTWRGSLNMANAARLHGVQLTFNHQRRYGEPYAIAKRLIDDGEIGDLVRFESEFGNIYDTGTHFIDMMSFFLGDGIKAEWILAQIDYRTENRVFGGHCENQQILIFEYENGVFGFVYSGRPGGADALGVINRIIGTEGIIDVGVEHGAEGAIRWRKLGDTEWRHPDTNGESIHGPGFIDRAIADVIGAYREGRKCQLDAENALIATEIIFGAYQSSRKRGRVDFPLAPEIGNPLQEMTDTGALHPEMREN